MGKIRRAVIITANKYEDPEVEYPYLHPAKGFAKVVLPGDPEKEIYVRRIKEGIP